VGASPTPPRTPSGPPIANAGAHRRFVPGTVFGGRYRIIERIGRGGMGEVYRADDLHLDVPVALKFLPAGLEDDATEWQRLRGEVRTARQVTDQNVCRVYDIGEVEGVPFLTMQFVDGEDLASLLLRIGRLSPDKANEIAREICAGLKAIHHCDLVHRDLKPGNIMIDGRGHARITDFGLALLQASAGHGPEVAGTPGYMAPETIARGEVSTRSDIYALGLVLHEVFTGQHALHSSDGGMRPRGGGSTSPVTPVRGLDPALERVVHRCLEREPSKRPSSVEEVIALLPGGGDALDAAIKAGETPSPEMIKAAVPAAMTRSSAWACLATALLGLTVLGLFGSRGRVVPQLSLPDPSAVLEARARDHLRALGVPLESRATARGFLYARDRVENIAGTDRSRGRWGRIGSERPAVVRFWTRTSPTSLEPWHWRQRISPSDPPLALPGMALAEVDTRGRLERLSVVPRAQATTDTLVVPDWAPLFAAAGLDSSRFRPVPPHGPLPAYADTRAAWEGADPENPAAPLHMEAASLGGRVVSFSLTEGGERGANAQQAIGDGVPVRSQNVRATLLVLSFLLAAWLARRHLRAGVGDRQRAMRAASVVMGLRFAHWILSGHPVPGDVPGQFALALAWALYDFAYMRIFYLAVEPLVRRLWPRILISWVRLVDGGFRDPVVGRDLLVGTLLGVVFNLGTVAHRLAPTLWGAPPGRPDNVGFVEPTLNILMGTWPQLAQGIESTRSSIIIALSFIVVLVGLRLVVRRPAIAIALSSLVFLPLGMPLGDVEWLDASFAAVYMVGVLFVLFRYGLVAATVGLTVNAVLQSTPFHGTATHWSAPGTALQLVMVTGGAVWGLYTALGGRDSKSPLVRALEG
jgi:serine/threonine-protein kinase